MTFRTTEKLRLIAGLASDISGYPVVKEIHWNTRLEDLGIDSLTVFSLISALEESLQKEISEERLSGAEVSSVSDIADLFEQ